MFCHHVVSTLYHFPYFVEHKDFLKNVVGNLFLSLLTYGMNRKKKNISQNIFYITQKK